MQYGMHEGTSQSAGYVAGAAALLLAAHRAAGVNATGAQMKSLLINGAAPSAQLASRCKSGASCHSSCHRSCEAAGLLDKSNKIRLC